MKLRLRVAAMCLAVILVLGVFPSGSVYADNEMSGGGEEVVTSEAEDDQPEQADSPDDSSETEQTDFSDDSSEKEQADFSDDSSEKDTEASSDDQPEADTVSQDESADVSSIDMDALIAWVQAHPKQLSALYKGDTTALAALTEALAVSEELVSTCVSDLKDQNDILVKAMENGTDVLGTISKDTPDEAAKALGVDRIAIDLFGIKLNYVSKLLNEAMEEAKENGQEEAWYQELGEALGAEDKLSDLAGTYDVEPAVLGALLQSMGIEAITSTGTSLTPTSADSPDESSEEEPEASSDDQSETDTVSQDESADVSSIDMDALTAWVQEHPEQLSALYKGDTTALAALTEALAVSEELVSTCVSDLKDQNDILVKAMEDGTDVLSMISFDTAEDAAEALGVDTVAIDLFGIKLGYVSGLLSEAMDEAEENGQLDTWYQELGEALSAEDKLSDLAGTYDVEPAVLGALLQTMGIEAIASTDTSLTLTNVELETPAGVDDTFVYQIFLWTTSSSGTVSALTGPYGDTEFEATRLYYTTAIGYQLPYDSYYTTYGYTEIPLNAGQSVTIPGLPEGCNYMILVSASANYYVKNATCTYGTVDDRIGAVYVYSASGPNEVVCYNDYAPNSLRITEAVISSDPDSVYDTFTFTIYLYSHSSTGDTPLFEGDSVNVEISIDGTGPAGLPTDLGSTLTFKTQSPDPDDPSVKLPGLDVTGTYNVATVTLKHGQSIVLKNLGQGYGCYVYQTPETHYMLYELASRHVYEKGIIADDFVGSYNEYYDYINSCNVSASLGFTNAQETLSITKQVVGSDTTRNYVFNVYFLQYLPDTDSYSPLRAGTFPLTYTNPTGNEPTTVEIGQRSDLSKQTTLTSSAIGSYTVQWSSAQIQVAAGQTVTIEKLPAAIAYFIEEVPVTNYTLTSATTTAASGVVNSRYNVYNWLSLTDEAATFTNTYVPPEGKDLTISKTVTGSMGDTNQAFSFDIALTDQSGSPLSSQDIQVLLPGKSAATMYTTDASGHLTLSLKHGQQATLKDLPQGTQYTIAETDAGSYTTTFQVTGGSYETSTDATVHGALDGTSDVVVQVNNNLELPVPTGIRTETEPFLLLLVCSMVTLLLMILVKKRNVRR